MTEFKLITEFPSPLTKNGRVWQGFEWRELFEVYGRRTWLAGLRNHKGEVIAFALMFSPRFLGRDYQIRFRDRVSHILNPRLNLLNGPIVIDKEKTIEVHQKFCIFLRSFQESRHFGEIRIRLPLEKSSNKLKTEEISAIYTRNGFELDEKYTFVVPTNLTIDELRSRVHPKRRNKLNRAVREEIKVDEVLNESGIERYWRIRVQNWRRNNLPIVPILHFQDTWKVLYPHSAIRIFVSHKDGHDLAGQVLFISKNEIQLNGVAVSDYNIVHSLPGNDFLQWYIIEWAQRNKKEFIDYGGATPATKDPKERGIHSFKKSFGGDLVQHQQFRRINPNLRRSVLDLFVKIKTKAIWRE